MFGKPNRIVSTHRVSKADGTRTTTLVTNTYEGAPYNLTDLPGVHEHDSAYNTNFGYRGNVVGSTTPAATKLFQHDIGGNITTTTVNGVYSTVATSSSTNYAAPSQMTTNTLSSTANWTSALGLSSAAGPNGDTASFGYDSNGRPTSTTSPTGAVTNYTYADSASPPYKTATTNTHWVQTAMDGFGRTVQTLNTGASVVATHYDPCGCSPLGKISQVSQPFAPNGSVYWTNYTYDASGRTTKVTLPDSSATTYAYQGNTVTVTDPAGKTKTFTMDAFGNLTKVVETDPTLGQVSTNYTYDILNHLITVSMPRGSNTQTRTFNYIPSGTSTVGAFLLSAINPENGTVSYTYNSNGLLASKTDAKGQVFTYFYDIHYNRLYQIKLNGSVLRTFIYDTNNLDGTFTTYGAGRLVAVQNAQFTPGSSNPTEFTEMYSYTKAGQPNKKRLQTNLTALAYPYPVYTANLDAAYTYDTEGKMTSVSYPNAGPTYTYSFDSMSRPIGLTDQNNYAAVSSVQYAPSNQMLSLNYFGVSESRTYNTLMQLTNITIPGQLNLTYNYPSGTNNGKISSQSDAISGETVTYAYDSLNRLLSALGSGWTDTYAYDGFGNLITKTPTGGAPQLSILVGATTNQIQGVSGLSYDNNGNELYGGVAYDPENRLLTAPGVEYAYDSRNKRVWKGTFSGSTLTAQEAYFYGVDGQKLGTYSLTLNGTQITATTTQTAVFFGGKRVAVNGAAFGQDRLGSNAAGKFFPYGEDRGTPIANDQVKFATYTRDSATGLDYADQRYYTNQFGRFMSPDPGGIRTANPSRPASLNRYAYTEGDPVNFADPHGLYLVDCVWDGGCANIKGNAGNYAGDWGSTSGGATMGGVLSDDEAAAEAQYDAYVSRAMAVAAFTQNATPDPNCVQNAINAAAGALGLGQALGTFTNVSVQIAGTANSNGGTYGETELNLSGGDVQALINAMCAAGFYSNYECQANNTALVGSPHMISSGPNAGIPFTGNFRSPGLTNSVQVNTDVTTGDVQIDVDPYNPAAYPILGLILHGVLQVIPNMLTGGDNTYGCHP